LPGGKRFRENELKGGLFLQMLPQIWELFYSEPTNIASPWVPCADMTPKERRIKFLSCNQPRYPCMVPLCLTSLSILIHVIVAVSLCILVVLWFYGIEPGSSACYARAIPHFLSPTLVFILYL
jgi:hypothetical protein